MTNYQKWERFDVENSLKETDNVFKLEDRSKNTNIAVKNCLEDVNSSFQSAELLAETLQAKLAVDALKQKLPRRRKNHIRETNEQQGILTDSSDNKQPEIVKTETVQLQEILSLLGASLSNFFQQINEIRSLMENETKNVHAGYKLSLQLLLDVVELNDAQFNDNLHRFKDPSILESASKVIESYDRSKAFLTSHACNFLSIFALHMGNFALSCDVCRLRLKLDSSTHISSSLASSKQAIEDVHSSWIVRSFAWANIGSVYLTAQDLREQRHYQPWRTNLDPIDSYMKSLEKDYLLQFHQIRSSLGISNSLWIFVLLDLFHGYRYLKSVSNKAIFYPDSSLSNEIVLLHFQHVLEPLRKDIASISSFLSQKQQQQQHQQQQQQLDMNSDLSTTAVDEMNDGTTSRTDKSSSVLSILEIPNLGTQWQHVLIDLLSSTSSCWNMSHLQQLFYQAQLLWIENLYFSAEFRYWTVFLIGMAQFRREMEDDHHWNMELSVLLSSCLLNIVMTRLKRNQCVDGGSSSLVVESPLLPHIDSMIDLDSMIDMSQESRFTILKQCQVFDLYTWDKNAMDMCNSLQHCWISWTCEDLCQLSLLLYPNILPLHRKVLICQQQQRYSCGIKLAQWLIHGLSSPSGIRWIPKDYIPYYPSTMKIAQYYLYHSLTQSHSTSFPVTPAFVNSCVEELSRLVDHLEFLRKRTGKTE